MHVATVASQLSERQMVTAFSGTVMMHPPGVFRSHVAPSVTADRRINGTAKHRSSFRRGRTCANPKTSAYAAIVDSIAAMIHVSDRRDPMRDRKLIQGGIKN